MKYGIYFREPNTTHAFKRHCNIVRNRDGLLMQRPIVYCKSEDANFEVELLKNLGYEVEIKEVK